MKSMQECIDASVYRYPAAANSYKGRCAIGTNAAHRSGSGVWCKSDSIERGTRLRILANRVT